jgi:hypothetical protein
MSFYNACIFFKESSEETTKEDGKNKFGEKNAKTLASYVHASLKNKFLQRLFSSTT